MPILERQFQNSHTKSRKLLKHLQLGTSSLLSVCNNANNSKDRKLASYVSAVKKSLELWNSRVKVVLTDNGCADDLLVGSSNVHGKDIESFSVQSDNENNSSIRDSEIRSKMKRSLEIPKILSASIVTKTYSQFTPSFPSIFHVVS